MSTSLPTGMERDLQRLKTPRTVVPLLTLIVIWMLYVASGFRLPSQPILLSDTDSGAAIRQIVFSATGMFALARLFLTRSLGSVLSANIGLTALAAFLVMSALWSVLPGLTLKRSIIYIFGFLGLVTLVHSSRHPVRLMLRSVVYFTAVVSSVSLILYFSIPKIHTVNPGRPGLAGISNHPNTLAPFLSIGFLLSLGHRPAKRKEKRWLQMARGSLFTGLILTSSITTILTTLLGLFIYLFLSAKGYRKGLIQLLTVGGILIVGLIGTSTLKSSFFGATGRDESLSGRDVLWHEVWIECQLNPVIGNGFGAFWTEGKGRDLVQTWNPRQSHNAYLDVILDLGGAGLLAVLLAFPIRLSLTWRRIAGAPDSAQRAASSAMMAVAFSYMTLYSFGQSFFLRFDVFPFFAVAWITLLVTNSEHNKLTHEFGVPHVS